MNNHSQKEWVCLRDAANNNLLVLYHLFGFFNKKGKKWVRVLDVKTLKDTLYLQFRFSTERLYYYIPFSVLVLRGPQKISPKFIAFKIFKLMRKNAAYKKSVNFIVILN